MKPFIKLSLVLLAAISLFAFTSKQIIPGKIKSLKPGIGVEIEIGKKVPDHTCPKFGFCVVKIHFDFRTGGAVGRFEYDADQQTIDWTVSSDELRNYAADKLSYFEGQSSVTFEDDTELPQDIRDAFGIRSDVSLKAGTYSVTEVDGIFTVSGIQVQ